MGGGGVAGDRCQAVPQLTNEGVMEGFFLIFPLFVAQAVFVITHNLGMGAQRPA